MMKFLLGLLIVLGLTDAQAVEVKQPKGYYIMQAVSNQNVSDTKLKSVKNAGIVIRVSWAKLNPAPGKYNWSFLDSQIARCKKYNKQYILSIYTGSNAPSWITGIKFGPNKYKLAPLPWSESMLTAYEQMVSDVGKRLNSDPLLVGVEIGGPTCPDMSIEMHFTNNVERQKGYSIQAMINAWNRAGSACAKAFPNCAVITDGGPAPGGNNVAINNAYYDYMFKNYKSQFNVSHCSLAAKTNENWIGHKLVSNHFKNGGRVGFEQVCASVNRSGQPISRYGGTLQKSLDIGSRAGMSWLKYYQDDEALLPKTFNWK